MKTPKNEHAAKESRHGKLAPTTAQTSITMKREVLNKAKEAAKAENRNLSNFLETVLRQWFEEEDRKKGKHRDG